MTSLAQFRALAPERRAIPLQRWGPRRILLVVGLLLGALLVGQNIYGMFTPADLPISASRECGTGDVMILMAQSVPTATAVPCIESFPAGWDPTGSGSAAIGLASGCTRATTASTSRCARPAPASSAAKTRCRATRSASAASSASSPSPPDLRVTRRTSRTASCVTYDFAFEGEESATLIGELDGALAFQPRRELVAAVEDRSGLSLCGAGAPPCVGGAP